MRKVFLIIFLIGLVIVAGGSFLGGRENITICWDGLKVDEPLLMELCGMTKEDYYSGNFNPEDCPEAEQAVSMTGGCETDWPMVWLMVGSLTAIYLLISGVLFGIGLLIGRLTRGNKAQE